MIIGKTHDERSDADSRSGGPPRSTSDVVSGALLEARINVDLLTLDEWKAILFGAFQAVSEASSLPPALSEKEFVARETLWKTTVNH